MPERADIGAAPTLGRLVANLRASGYSPDQVDVVLITHLHADHVGGIYGADGSRVFRNAEIRMAKADSDFWLSTDIASKAPPDAQVFFQVARDAAAPYVAAGKWRPFEGTDPIVPGVRPYPIVGHTPGHMGYEVTSKGQSLLVWGDVVHIMAVQMARPGVGIEFDIDGPTAIKAREKLFAKLSASKTLVAGAHMPFPSLGYLRREGSGYAWVPVVFKDLSATASAELSEARARELIAPWYGLFNQPVAADTVKAVHEQLLSPDYQSCWGVLAGECWGREQSDEGGRELRQIDSGYEVRHQGSAGLGQPGDRAWRGFGYAVRRTVRRPSRRKELPHHGCRYPDYPRRENRTDLSPGELAQRAWPAAREAAVTVRVPGSEWHAFARTERAHCHT